MNPYRDNAWRSYAIRMRFEDDWMERYRFWLACHGKRDTLFHCLEFLARCPS